MCISGSAMQIKQSFNLQRSKSEGNLLCRCKCVGHNNNVLSSVYVDTL